jgi:Transposase DDE domain
MDSKNTDLFIKDIKEIITFFNKDTKNYLINNTNTIYDYKSNIMDGLLYLLLNTQNKSTHLNSSILISKFNNIKITRQSLDKRASHIKLNDLNKIINDFYNKFLYVFSNDFNITDGVAINVYDPKQERGYKKIKLLTVVNSKSVPEELHINKDIYKSEIKIFYDLLENGYYDNNKTFLLDALYFSDKLVNYFYNNNLSFIGRMKNNSLHLTKFNVELQKNNFLSDYKVINKEGNIIRIINYKIDNKIYHIATNLLDSNKYNTEYFKNAYKKRW